MAATAGKVLLRWALQRGCSVTPKSQSVARIAENGDVFGFRLSEEEMASIAALGVGVEEGAGRLCWRTDPLRLLDFA